MPYLSFSTYYTKSGTKSNEAMVRNRELFETYGVKSGGNDGSNKNGQKTSGEILHGTRTLDQYYYYSPLADTEDRDSSQVVTRYLDNLDPENPRDRKAEEATSWEILNVDQLWLWVIDEGKLFETSLDMKSNNCH